MLGEEEREKEPRRDCETMRFKGEEQGDCTRSGALGMRLVQNMCLVGPRV